MKSDYFYFLITDGPVLAAILADQAARRQAAADMWALSQKYGAKGYTVNSSSFGGLLFDTPPTTGWRNLDSRGWYPKVNTNAGRAIFAEMTAINLPSKKWLYELFCTDLRIDGRRLFEPSYGQLNAQWVVLIPAGAPCTPPTGCTKLKMSEVWRMHEEEEAKKNSAPGKPCPHDTNGDGNCGRPLCPQCGSRSMPVKLPDKE